MNIAPQPSPRGIALIMVMAVILMLSILAGGFAYSMKIETRLARNQGNDNEMEWLARSGVELAKYVLSLQMSIPGQQNMDALNQKWAGGVGVTNDLLADITLENNPLGPGFFSIKIIDQERKLNVNTADPLILQQAMTLLGVEASESSTIVDAILDWRDPDDDTHLSGAETDFYLGLNPPYYAKNGPIDDISELLLIRGITPELYGGTNGAENAFHTPIDRQPIAGSINNPISFGNAPAFTGGLKDLFSAIAAARINLNTAPPEVLQLVPGIDANVAQGIQTFRAGPDGVEGNEDDMPFTTPGQIISIPGINRQFGQQLSRYFDVRSYTFEVQVEATIGNYTRYYSAMLRRNNARDIQVLYFHPR